MIEFYIVIVVLLLILAATDLMVGVANDAVNFLNSAIGAKVAPRHIILLVASLGVFVGATFSSGLMEVARKGIFNPELFVFADVMVIFLAVMITDIMLLDLFNTFGLPTSTTVSLIFELLGAAVAVALIKIVKSGALLSTLPDYINTSSATEIVSAIFSSVAISFVVGSLVQYFSRLLFTFHYERRMKWVGGIWSGAALALLTYFLLFKGIKGASFVSEGFVKWVGTHTTQLLVISCVFWTLIMQTLITVFRVNVLKVVVLFGTFSLAMAFAGNDLVNFIGAPIAGLESFMAWRSSGIPADEFNMGVLGKQVKTNTVLLLIAGAIMVLTLWLSKKARSVTDTEVSLGRQDEGIENFAPNFLARGIVNIFGVVGIGLRRIFPESWRQKMEQSFQPVSLASMTVADRPSFDLVRASVNLTAASMLIAFATSLKLPLSTTYVSFMVAMGTSLADKAWGRDSAVYRVAGVLNVIAGWFFTAIIAFTVAATVAWFIHTFGPWAVGVMVLALIYFFYHTYTVHKKREKAKAEIQEAVQESVAIPATTLVDDTSRKVGQTVKLISDIFRHAITSVLKDNPKGLKQAGKEMAELLQQSETLKNKLFFAVKRIQEERSEASRLYLLVYDLEQDLIQSTDEIVTACRNHVENRLSPPEKAQTKSLLTALSKLDDYFKLLSQRMKDRNFANIDDITALRQGALNHLEEMLSIQIAGIKSSKYGFRNTSLMFTLLLETKDLVQISYRFAELYHRLHHNGYLGDYTFLNEPSQT
ncbi:MAG TPA: inorganic phosphate transporter [Saprospiraceae bacterium]|jgi:phosphate/sulfate permease|nr:inorganic phosphate transporter [Saprospiraceae bacterium]